MDHVPLGGSTEGALPALYPAGHQVDPSSVAMMPVVERILLPSWRPRQRGNDAAAGIVMTALSALSLFEGDDESAQGCQGGRGKVGHSLCQLCGPVLALVAALAIELWLLAVAATLLLTMTPAKTQ